jgi:hypothetical protein
MDPAFAARLRIFQRQLRSLVDLTNPDIVDRDTIILSKSLLRGAHGVRGPRYALPALHRTIMGGERAALLSLSFGADSRRCVRGSGMTRARRGVAEAEMGEGWCCRPMPASMERRAGWTCVSSLRRPHCRLFVRPTGSNLRYRLPLFTRRRAAIRAKLESAPFLRVMRRTHREMKQLIRSPRTALQSSLQRDAAAFHRGPGRCR